MTPGAQGHSLTGTWTLVRFVLRRDRVRLPVWIVSITFMVLLTTVSSLFLYAVVALAALKQPLHGVARLVVAIAFVFALWTFYGAGAEAFLWGLALLIVGWPVRWLSRRFNSSTANAPAVAPGAPPGSSA